MERGSDPLGVRIHSDAATGPVGTGTVGETPFCGVIPEGEVEMEARGFRRLSLALGIRTWIVGLVIAAAVRPASMAGQEVSGRLLESETRQPIVWGTLALLDTAFNAVTQTLSSPTGAFVLEAPEAGSFYVLAEALGYEPKADGILELGEGGSVSIEFYLKPKPLEMDSLIVAMRRVRTYRYLTEVGYYERKNMGFGTFVSPEEIQRRRPFTTSDLLRNVPDLYIEEGDRAGTRVYLVRGGSRCNPSVLVDGSRVFNDPHTERGGPLADVQSARNPSAFKVEREDQGIVLERMVDIEDISAVEVHTRPTSIPLQYGGTQETCGLLMVWTHIFTGTGG